MRFRLTFREELTRAQESRQQAAAAQESVDRLMAHLDGPLRDMLSGDGLDEEAKAALREAFAQFEADTRDLKATADGEEALDANQLHQKMEEAFEEFHATLKSIFGIEEEETVAGGESADEETASSDEVRSEATSPNEAAEEATETEQGEEADEQDAVLEEIVTTYQKVLEALKSEEGAEDTHSLPGEAKEEDVAYAKFAAMYEGFHNASSEAISSLDAEG